MALLSQVCWTCLSSTPSLMGLSVLTASLVNFLSEKHFDKNPKVFCLTPSEKHYPYGVPKLNIYHNTNVYITVVPPGGFYSVERKPNDIRIDKKLSSSFTIRFELSFKLIELVICQNVE